MSKYITRPIGEIYEYNNVTLQVVERRGCEGCYFYHFANCMNKRRITGHCGHLLREDRKSVIFKQIIEKL